MSMKETQWFSLSCSENHKLKNNYKLCSYKFCFCCRWFFQYSSIQWFRNEIWINFFSIKICIDSWIIKVAMLKSYFLFKVKSLLLNLIWNFDDNKRFINDHRIIANENSEIPHAKFHIIWNIDEWTQAKWTISKWTASKMYHIKNGPYYKSIISQIGHIQIGTILKTDRIKNGPF